MVMGLRNITRLELIVRPNHISPLLKTLDDIINIAKLQPVTYRILRIVYELGMGVWYCCF